MPEQGLEHSAAGKTLQVLTRSEGRLVEAIAACIFPTTDTPGATEAGAVFYIDTALATDYRPLLPRYRRAMRELQRFVRERHNQRFEQLEAAEQRSILSSLESGTMTEVRDGAVFFSLIREHTLEGVFGEPQYGGNRGLVGWSLIGFPGQRHGYADAYIDRVIDLAPVAVDGNQSTVGA